MVRGRLTTYLEGHEQRSVGAGVNGARAEAEEESNHVQGRMQVCRREKARRVVMQLDGFIDESATGKVGLMAAQAFPLTSVGDDSDNTHSLQGTLVTLDQFTTGSLLARQIIPRNFKSGRRDKSLRPKVQVWTCVTRRGKSNASMAIAVRLAPGPLPPSVYTPPPHIILDATGMECIVRFVWC